MFIRRIVAVAVAVAAVLVPVMLAASAQAQRRGGTCHTLPCQEKYLYHKVMGSKHPHATFKALPVAKKKLFIKATAVVKMKVAKDKIKNVPPPASPANHKNWVCQTSYSFLDWKNIFGGTTEGTWINTEWCWDKVTVLTTLNKMLGQGGETSTPGWAYLGLAEPNDNGTGNDQLVADQVSVAKFSVGFNSSFTDVDRCSQSSWQGGWHFVYRTCRLHHLAAR